MDKERKEQLEKDAENRTDEDRQLMHVIYVHIATAFAEMSISKMEAEEIEDERAKKMAELLEQFKDQLNTLTEEIINSIPGIMTKEEAEAEMRQMELSEFIDMALRPTINTGEEEDDDHDGHFTEFEF